METIRVVGFGGTYRPGSSTERAIRTALAAAEAEGAETVMLGAEALDLPIYRPDAKERSPAAKRLVDEVRRADAIVLGSPGYHGSMSGLLKNALDYLEDLRDDARPYLDGRAVACIATGDGWQATTTTLVALRTVVHALRGWPTPLGVVVNTREAPFDAEGRCTSAAVHQQLELVGRQAATFARRWKR